MGTTGVLDTVINSGESFVDIFSENIIAIFAHDKTEILEALEKIDNEKLLTLRGCIFSKLQDIITVLTNRELFSRRKKKYIAEDIYLIGFSLVNNIEYAALRKILKPNNEESVSLLEESSSDSSDILETCTALKSTVDRLLSQVNGLVNRVSTLESEVTSMKAIVTELQETHKQSVTESTLEEPAETVTQSCQQKDPATGEDASNKGSNTASLENNTIVKNPVSTLEAAVPTNACSPKVFNLKAADEDSKVVSQVYVGSLQNDTTVVAVQEHLNGIGVQKGLVTVAKLTSKNVKQAPFRIDFCSRDAAAVTLLPEKGCTDPPVCSNTEQWKGIQQETTKLPTEI